MESNNQTLTELETQRLGVLRTFATCAQDNAKLLGRTALRYKSSEELVLALGRVWRVSEMPPDFKAMPLGECFRNAHQIAERSEFSDDPLYYCEGFAISPHGFPFHHGWVVKPDGTAHDPTWHKRGMEDYTYIGIPFRHRFLLQLMCKTKLYGVLCDGNREAQRALCKMLTKGFPRGAVLQIALQTNKQALKLSPRRV